MTTPSEVFAAIVGAEYVVSAGQPAFDERYFIDPYAFHPGFTFTPPGAVQPGSTSEVQEIVRAANEHNIGLWVVSRGRNLGYGAGMPRSATDWVLDLSRLDRIISVDLQLGIAVIEPGVSFFALYEHLRSMNAPFWASVPDISHGSVVANALERGFGYSAHGEHGRFLCGLEVVTPEGDVFRTGMAADSDSRSAFAYKGGIGPDILGLFQQSNLGIVTQAGVWLFPRPETAAAILVHVPEPSDLGALVDTVRPLQLGGSIDSVTIIGNALAIISGVMPRSAIWENPGLLPREVIMGVAEKMHIGFWNAKFGVYGPDSVVRAKVAHIENVVAKQLPQATVSVNYYPGEYDPATVFPGDKAQLAIAADDMLQMGAWRGGVTAHTDLAVVCPTIGSDAQRLVDMTRERLEAGGLDHVGGFTMFGRHAIFLSLLSFDGANAKERAMVTEVLPELVENAVNAGYAPYRAHTAMMDRISDAYDFNEHALRRFVTKIKDAVDPRGIISAGKQGIWPGGVRPHA